jgi:hypothetical protein
MSSADLVREVKYRAKIDRDVELAEKVNVGKANVSSWLKRGTKPDAIALLDLMILGNLDAKETKRILQGGFSTTSLLLVTSFASTLGLALMHYSSTMYIMLNRFKRAATVD